MELYQRKGADGTPLSPFYYYDVTMPDGTRRRRSTKERTKAKAQAVMVAAIHSASEDAKAGPKRITLRDALKLYAADLEGRGKDPYLATKHVEKTFGDGFWGSKKTFRFPVDLWLDDLDTFAVERLKTARLKESKKVATLAQELRSIRAAVSVAERHGFRVPKVNWRIPIPAAATRWLTPAEWQSVYEELDPMRPAKNRWGDILVTGRLLAERITARDLFVALTLCGGRWGEVTSLTSDQVIPGDPVRLRIYGWKTKQERMVPVPPVMADMLLRRAAEALEAGTPYLFPRPKHRVRTAPVGHVQYNQAIRSAMARAGVNAPHIVARQGVATIHSLRHTFASWLRQNGLALSEIQELLGHQDFAMTRRYVHIAPNVTVDAASGVLSQVVSKMFPGTAQSGHSEEQDL